MGGYPIDEELGALVAPPQSGGWADLLKDPVSRSALLSFGLQAMTGGWGNGTQQLVAALGAGASGAAGTAKSIQEQENLQQKRDDLLGEGQATRESREREAGLNRASRQEIAGMQAANRMEIQGLKNEARLAAEGIKLQRASPSIAIKYRAEARKIVEGNISNLSLPQAQREQMIEELANRTYAVDEARGRVPKSTGVEDAIKPAKPTNSDQSTTPPATRPSSFDIGLFPPKMIFGEANVKFDRMKNDPKFGAQFQELLKTPEGREKILEKNPDLAPILQNLGN